MQLERTCLLRSGSCCGPQTDQWQWPHIDYMVCWALVAVSQLRTGIDIDPARPSVVWGRYDGLLLLLSDQMAHFIVNRCHTLIH
jgi:hypothetical protein